MWAQYTYLVCFIAAVTVHLVKFDEPVNRYYGSPAYLLSFMVEIFILTAGGFFKGVFN